MRLEAGYVCFDDLFGLCDLVCVFGLVFCFDDATSLDYCFVDDNVLLCGLCSYVCLLCLDVGFDWCFGFDVWLYCLIWFSCGLITFVWVVCLIAC